VPAFYVKFRNDDLRVFTHGFLRNIARDSFNEVASTFPVDELYGQRKEEFLNAVRSRVNAEVAAIGVQVEQFGFIGAMRLPQGVVDALNSKIAATQRAIQAENELRQAEAEAQKAIAKARGEAQSNEILTKSLTSSLLEWRQLEILDKKWNGAYPLYVGGGGSPVPMIQLQSGR
jgi:regulator of protease activity HflC (stomatin/prohibitin superfamily)